MAVLHLQGSEIWGAGWSQGEALGEPGLRGRHLASWPARPGLVSRQKWGCGD